MSCSPSSHHAGMSAPAHHAQRVDAHTSRWYVGSNASQWTVCANSTPSCLRSTFLLLQRAISKLHMNLMKNSAFVGNTGHFDNEIDMADPEGWEGMKVNTSSLRKSCRLPRPTRCDRAKENTALDLAGSESWEGMKVDNIKPQVDPFVFPVAVLCVKNTRHFVKEIDLAGSRGLDIKFQKTFSSCPLATMRKWRIFNF